MENPPFVPLPYRPKQEADKKIFIGVIFFHKKGHEIKLMDGSGCMYVDKLSDHHPSHLIRVEDDNEKILAYARELTFWTGNINMFARVYLQGEEKTFVEHVLSTSEYEFVNKTKRS